jgi:GDP-mannose 6-dehydrogenase
LHIAVLGLGHVGTTALACLAASGHHQLVGIDPHPGKVAAVGAGRSPVVEPGLDELLRAGVAAGRIGTAATAEAIVDRLDLAIVCVGTPAGADGGLDPSRVVECARQLGAGIRRRAAGHPLLVVVRSTVPPGTMDGLVLPALAGTAGRGPGQGWEAAYNPEFLREGSAVDDWFAPPKIVVGEREAGVTRRLRGLYDGIEAPCFEVPFAVAELGKLVDNGWHAVKVAFANEVGRIAVGQGAAPEAVAELFLADAKLNLSAAYLRPGGPYGGPCLPKDLAGLAALARAGGLEVPVLEGAQASNRLHLGWLVAAIRARVPPPGPLLLLGLSFKAGTDDLRQSPLLELAARLVEAGYRLTVHDPDLDPARLVGANLAVAAEHRGILEGCLTPDPEAAGAGARLIVLGKQLPGSTGRLPVGVPVLDLANLHGF